MLIFARGSCIFLRGLLSIGGRRLLLGWS